MIVVVDVIFSDSVVVVSDVVVVWIVEVVLDLSVVVVRTVVFSILLDSVIFPVSVGPRTSTPKVKTKNANAIKRKIFLLNKKPLSLLY